MNLLVCDGPANGRWVEVPYMSDGDLIDIGGETYEKVRWTPDSDERVLMPVGGRVSSAVYAQEGWSVEGAWPSV